MKLIVIVVRLNYNVESVSKPIVEDQRFQTLRSDFVFFAVFVFLFCSMKSPIFSSLVCSHWRTFFQTLNSALNLKASLVHHRPQMLSKCHPFFFVFSFNMFFAHVSLSNRFPTIQITKCTNNQLSEYRCIFVLVLRVIWTLFNKVV